MYKMVWHITIGKFRLLMLESCVITRSVEMLADTAVITLPGTAYNKTLEVEDKIQRGDAVTIQLGYDDNLVSEFEGYLESVSTDGGSIKLNCEDALFLYRKPLDNIELKNKTVKELISYIHKALGLDFKVSCDYDFTYDKFTISGATGYDVLKKIQEEANPNIYLKDNVLHVHPQYTEIFGTANYDFAKNIDREGTDLKYLKASERKWLIEVEGKGADGKVIKVEAGITGGDRMSIKIPGVSNKTSLQNKANEVLKQKVYTGYEGSFTGWLIPYCDAGYRITIKDKDYEYKDGAYYVLEVKTEFSKDGGKRIVKPGKKLNDE
jgi:hypothetical protein